MIKQYWARPIGLPRSAMSYLLCTASPAKNGRSIGGTPDDLGAVTPRPPACSTNGVGGTERAPTRLISRPPTPLAIWRGDLLARAGGDERKARLKDHKIDTGRGVQTPITAGCIVRRLEEVACLARSDGALVDGLLGAAGRRWIDWSGFTIASGCGANCRAPAPPPSQSGRRCGWNATARLEIEKIRRPRKLG